ncbi:MAG: DEAD/DEAH box helicase, partial [Candidatus Hydrogenedentes bacterium]|nr:DEAD/DEAH box helicase [Candidatus Hydrogenedentota bacterium]
CRHIVADMDTGYWGRSGVDYYLPTRALTALVGHPHIFLMDTTISVDVVAATPELQVTKTKRALKLTMNPPKPENDDVYVERVGDSRIVVYEYTPEICQVAKIVGKGVEAPAKAKEDVLKAVGNVASMVTVHSDIGIADASIPKVDADATPLLQLLPSGEGLIVQLRIQPLPDGGPLFPPGAGGTAVIAEVEGTRIQTERNFETEKKNADEVIAACATLSNAEAWEGEWQLDEPESCLEFLVELEACEATMRVQWPKGQNYNIQGSAGMGQFRAKINGGHNWFELSGEVKVDDDLVLDMQRLLELTETSKSRFVDLGNGQFLALTRSFRKKLDELRGLGEMGDKGLRMHALAAPAMDDLVEQAASVKANKKWKDQVQRLQKARELDPKIPSTLQATLRDYQIDGYKWLARLAEWGVGACLADDMGLGKTVQILAVMLERATDGPQLVIAPTSVCMNWEDEARRFAPTLKVHRFGVGDREELMRDLGTFDVVVASYGLLHSESALFKEVDWQTIVLDEAQAIKNMATKRSKAAMDLNGSFKIIATGTPIENHLGELWNLYRFINPGFLGSADSFNKKFALPIEKYKDKDTRQHLRQLIQPFILRRLKGDVLDELPPRTDIVLHVELSKEERAFYEAIRQQALKNLSDVKAEPGKHHVRILAEIMRLRRACCNTQLVDEKSTLPSAKLEVFEAVLDELLENRHKALVFSQFVGHLNLLRALLDKKGISYQYLDGSTPAKKRKKAVDAFQAGEGDLFLISLKAGGVGLNLTAADYVIHMDPWWNPAVEDQASDRAHRIGQQRPVTVYRLVAKDTIEDQIVDLHHQKRDLASSLLEGSDMAGKVTAEQLLALLKNN